MTRAKTTKVSKQKPAPKSKAPAKAKKKVAPIPAGYHAITPYLIVRDGVRALEFYAKAFGAIELMRLPMGDKIAHAEIKIGDSIVMLADEVPAMDFRSPKAYGGTPVSLMLYVEDVDARVAKAVAAGARIVRPVKDQFYGDRSGLLLDPFGHQWTLATHLEDLTPEEISARMAEMHG
jgi:PhnB protein